MEKLYYKDLHLTYFEAIVENCIYHKKENVYHVLLDKTAFFPEEGGQVADRGNLIFEKRIIPVKDVISKDGIICHVIDCELAIGSHIRGEVDWNQRFDFMQQHTGEHIVSGLVNKYFGLTNVGFHLGLTEVTMDYNGSLSMEQLREIELKANEAVWANLPVEVSYPSPDKLPGLEYRSKLDLTENVRIITIPGIDCCACCAPHVKRTGEVGMIKITALQSHRGGVRVNILCGGRALADYTKKQDNIFQISAALSVRQDEASGGVNRLKQENVLYKEENNRLQTLYVREQILSLTPAPHIFLFTEPMNEISIRTVVNEMIEKREGYIGIFMGNDTDGYSYLIGSKTLDCRLVQAILKEKFKAKGGGKSPMIQGNVTASKEAIQNCLSCC